ncbi:centrosomal protein of 120 kDa-like [Physella acuta]|uniref:centrosomal protein of 120 kDa-like n=1 Tax=Physella acuta TaxID=109671 RepID=UPI0027DD48BC|nr:centrosomal protein of 120 kDa-like [Physella acuta]
MGSDRKYLAVISVIEGRGFPKRSRHKLIVEAKFDGELLSTDPVPHAEVPDINQELAWELDKKALQQHRLQRSSIKIQCYAYDTETTMKESVGYIVLDLRSAATNKPVGKWYQLLHSKYHKTKAEMKLALYLDEEGQQPIAPLTQPEPPVPKGVEIKSLVPVLNEEDGYYQIGPAKTCTEQFVLSITIAYATNLPQLIPSNTPLNSSGGFFFYYSLLGNDVTNEPFHDLVNPSFPAERASVKIRSSIDVLRSFFSRQPGLQIHLCCGDQSLGNCDIPLGGLLKPDSTEIYMKPVTIEGAFQLFPANKWNKANPVPSPSVGVSIVLRKEDMAVKSPVKENQQAVLVTGAAATVDGHMTSTKPDKPAQVQAEKKEKKQEDAQQHLDSVTEETSEPQTPQKVETKHQEQKVNKGSRPAAQWQQTSPVRGHQVNLLPDKKYEVSMPPQAHHFTFSIDLRSIRDQHSTNTCFVFLRYVYPFFGSAAPILTHPPVEIRKGSEVLLPQSFCAFDFACSMQQLQDTFTRVPLIVEVWHRDRQLSQDILIGTAKLPLNIVISADRMRLMSSAGVTGWRQEASDRIPVYSANGQSEKCADISLVLSLEDWGPIKSATSTQQNHAFSGASEFQGAASQAFHSNGETAGASSPRGTAEYQAAIELELWKENQEKEFEKKLKLKEATHMRTLAEEWKKRDTEREVLTQKKLAEYKHLEDQLRNTLTDLEKREKKLALNEHEVMKLRSDLQREHDRKLQEMKEASRRMKEDCDHQVELQKMKLKEIEEICSRYKQELNESEKKYRALEKEFSLYKEQQTKTPEVRLQSEINLLNMEKLELERKLDAASKSKLHYKQQWGRALKEVARLKQKEQDLAKAQLLRQQQELEHMRLRYLAAEEKEIVNKESKELEEIKVQINKLKQIEEERLGNTSGSNKIPVVKDVFGKPLNLDLDTSVDEHVARLVEERDTLLRTGVYTSQDKIIAELDRQIREAIGLKGR